MTATPRSDQPRMSALGDQPAPRSRQHRNRGRHTRVKILALAGGSCGLALLVHDPGVFAVLLVLVVVLAFLHALATRLSELDLLVPFLVGIGCLAVGLWWFFAGRVDVAEQFENHAPAPVKRLLSPVQRLVRRAPPGGSGGSGTESPAPGATGSPAGDRDVAPAGGISFESSLHEAITVTLDSSRSTSGAGEVVLFVARVKATTTDAGLFGDRVDLFDGATRIAAAPLVRQPGGYAAYFDIASLSVGRHSLTARYTGAHALPCSSAVLTHIVVAARR